MKCPTHPNSRMDEDGCAECILGWPPTAPDEPVQTSDQKEAEARANAFGSFPSKVEQVIDDFRSLKAAYFAAPSPEILLQVGEILNEMDRVGKALSLVARAEALQMIRNIKSPPM